MPFDPQMMQQQRNAIAQAMMARQRQGGAGRAMPGGMPMQGGGDNPALMAQQQGRRGTPGGFFPGTQDRMAPMRPGYEQFMPGGMPSFDQSNTMMQSQMNNPEIQQMVARYQSQMPSPPTTPPTGGMPGASMPQMQQQQQATLASSLPGMQRGM